MRVITPTLVALILVCNVACAESTRRDTANGNSSQTNPDQWQPSERIPGGFRRDLFGDPRQPGGFKYQLKIPAGARAAAHRHSKNVQVKVVSGSMFIIIGEPLELSRARHFATGGVFVVPEDAGMKNGGTRRQL